MAPLKITDSDRRNNAQRAEKPLQLILLGAPGVGKTSILVPPRERDLGRVCEATVAIDFVVKRIPDPVQPDREISLHIWDSAGQEVYDSITRNYYRRSECAILVFELHRSDTWVRAQRWFRELRQECPDAGIILVGNKADVVTRLTEEETVEWFQIWSEATQFAYENRAPLYSVSAATGESIDPMFQAAAKAARACRQKREPCSGARDSGGATLHDVILTEDDIQNALELQPTPWHRSAARRAGLPPDMDMGAGRCCTLS